MATKIKMLQAAAGAGGAGGFMLEQTGFVGNEVKCVVDGDGNIYNLLNNTGATPDTILLTKFSGGGELQWNVEIGNSLATTNLIASNIILLTDGNIAINAVTINGPFPQRNNDNIWIYSPAGVLVKSRRTVVTSHLINSTNLTEETVSGEILSYGGSYRNTGNAATSDGLSKLRFRPSDLRAIGYGGSTDYYKHIVNGGSGYITYYVKGFSSSETTPYGTLDDNQSMMTSTRSSSGGIAYQIRSTTSFGGVVYKLESASAPSSVRSTRAFSAQWYDGNFIVVANCYDSTTPLFGGVSSYGICVISFNAATGVVSYQAGFPFRTGPYQTSPQSAPAHEYTTVRGSTLYCAFNVGPTLDSGVYYDDIHVMSIDLTNGNLNYHYIVERTSSVTLRTTVSSITSDEDFIYISGTQASGSGVSIIMKLPIEDLNVGGTVGDYSILDPATLPASHPQFNQWNWTAATNFLSISSSGSFSPSNGQTVDGGTTFGTKTNPTYTWDKLS